MADLYQFFNFEVSKGGEPFALCKKHRREQKIPDGTVLNKIAEKALSECERCATVHDGHGHA